MNKDKMNIPNHVAIILDGNGRWAKEKGMKRSLGHLEGSKTLIRLGEHIFKKGIKVFSVFAFSVENFKRDKEEVDYLMKLFVQMFKNNLKYFIENGIKIVFSKKERGLPEKLEKLILEIEQITENNKAGIFNICINYGGQDEIVDTTKKICQKVLNNELKLEDIDKEIFADNLYAKLPPIDLLIRTSGEYRVSNFMLWQLSYAEMYFTNTYFPDFLEEEFDQALLSYNKRDRRFGGVKNEEKNSK